MKKNLTYDDCVRLSKSPRELDEYLRVRLVELTTRDDAVAMRAIEALMNMTIEDEGHMFDGISADDLRRVREKAYRVIAEIDSAGGD